MSLETATYFYSGPLQSVALMTKGADGTSSVVLDETLVPGSSYTLPTDHPVTKGLRALGLLTAEAN